jgi:hypothetical protein
LWLKTPNFAGTFRLTIGLDLGLEKLSARAAFLVSNRTGQNIIFLFSLFISGSLKSFLMNISRAALLCSVILVLATACGSNHRKKETASAETYDLEAAIRDAEAITPDLTSIDQVFDMLDMVEAGYEPLLTNDPYSAHGYKSSYPTAAANLGVYVTDLVYHRYGASSEAMFLTFAAAQELAKFIGVEAEVASMAIENLEGTLMKRDSITFLFNDLMREMDKYSAEQEMLFVYTAFLAGSFVEKTYISSSLLQQKMRDEEISNEEEGNIKELLVIYLNQLDPASMLEESFELQQEELANIALPDSFSRLSELAGRLREEKPALLESTVSDIRSNEKLRESFDLIAEMRTGIITTKS